MMKSIIIMRHASYDQISGDLTSTGIRHARSAADKLVEAGMIPDLIRYSPLMRALQTAETLWNVFNNLAGGRIPSTSADWLKPNGSPKINDILHALEGAQSIMLITHEPQVANISGQLGQNDIHLLPAEVIAFSFDKDRNSHENFERRLIFQLPRGKKAAAPQTP